MTGFPASVLARLVVGLAFMAGTGAMVWAIERPRGGKAAMPVAEQASGGVVARTELQLSIESSYRVADWTVRILGVDQPATRSDHVSWSGSVRLTPDDEVFIRATAKPEGQGSETLPHHSLRIRLGSAPDRFVWGSDDVTATVGMVP